MTRGRAPDSGRPAERMDFKGWLVWLVATLRLPMRTTEAFVPPRPVKPRDEVRAEFDALQERLIACVGQAERVGLGTLRVVSPFDSRVSYNLDACLRILPAHQGQHLRQAERVVRALRAETG
ncbi:MAG: DinB family protein [Candidatus Rokuibacteriota bacterium]